MWEPMTVLVAGIVAAVLSWGLVGWFRRFALQRSILDHPTHRSSHQAPTPRGGGAGLVTAILLVMLAAGGYARLLELGLLVALKGVALVAWVGWWDDRSGLDARIRLLAHLAAGGTILVMTLHPEMLPQWMGWAAPLWWLFWAVSAVNVVNFMDGIDGLIGSQMLFFGVYIMILGPPDGVTRLFGSVLAGACAGFLVWNWAPARIFMGDAGSGALGLLAVLGGILLMRETRVGLIPAFLPLYPLFLDATVTLVRRVLRGEQVTEAHRSHLYQRLANGGWGHARVSLLFGFSAGLGGLVVWVSGPDAWLGPAAAYFSAILLLGWILDRRVPFPVAKAEPGGYRSP